MSEQDEIITVTISVDPDARAIQRIQHKLNIDIGFGWWKRYIAAAFWSNVSTPLNLTITLLTAINTAQTTTSNMISQETFVRLSVSTLILTVMNTFFRPHTQMMENIKLLGKWTEFGNRFEALYYGQTPTSNTTTNNNLSRLEQYRLLQNDINAFENSVGPESQSFVTDLIHILARMSVLHRRDRWLDLDDTAQDV